MVLVGPSWTGHGCCKRGVCVLQIFLSRTLPLLLPTEAEEQEAEDDLVRLLRMSVPVPKTGTVAALKTQLSSMIGVDASLLLVADVFRGRCVGVPVPLSALQP